MENVNSADHLLVDITELARTDCKTGIQRVVRGIGKALLKRQFSRRRIVFVRCDGSNGKYVYASEAAERIFGHANGHEDGLEVEGSGDSIFLGLDLVFEGPAIARKHFAEAMARGMKFFFLVYDLIPLNMPEAYDKSFCELFANWIRQLGEFDGIACISRNVAEEVDKLINASGPCRAQIGWFHQGCDIENSQPSRGVPADAETVLGKLANRANFLMVGTIEPRKGHRDVMEAFKKLWSEKLDINLIFVSQRSWKMDDFISSINESPFLNKNLFYLPAISDEYLERIYAASSALIMASRVEGFGLPIIEAARRRLPLILRDIPVFREVAGEDAMYFRGDSSNCIADVVKKWLALEKEGKIPDSSHITTLTWDESAEMLVRRMKLEM